MCVYINSIYSIGSKVYYKLKVKFTKVEVIGVELDVIPAGVIVEKFEIIGPIILWTEDI